MSERQRLIDLLIARETIKDANAYDRAECLADYLLENGYRVQTEVAREIFEEIRNIHASGYNLGEYYEDWFAKLHKLKKKHTGEKDCRDCRYFVGCEKAVWTGPCEAFTETESTKTEEGVNEK